MTTVLSGTAALKADLLKFILEQIVVSIESVPRLSRFFDGVYPKWVFNAIQNGYSEDILLKPGVKTPMLHLSNIILWSDLEYFAARNPVTYNRDVIPESNSSFLTAIEVEVPKLSPFQLDRLKTLYTGDNFEKDVEILQGFYGGLGGTSNFLSVPPELKTGRVELFGSPFNTHGPYCSALQYEKNFFQSLGSFFDYQLVDNTEYIANPPFDETMIEAMAKRLNDQLFLCKETVVIIMLPDWPIASFKGRQTLVNSQFLVKSMSLPMNGSFSYFDYTTERFIKVCKTVLITLSNSEWISPDTTPDAISRKWAGATRRG